VSSVATTTLSSRGQVVIPESVRERLGLKPGDQFLVLGEGDVVILKTVSAPSLREFDSLIVQARKAARKARLRPTDVRKAISRARSRK